MMELATRFGSPFLTHDSDRITMISFIQFFFFYLLCTLNTKEQCNNLWDGCHVS